MQGRHISHNHFAACCQWRFTSTDFRLTTKFNKMQETSNLPQNPPLQQTACMRSGTCRMFKLSTNFSVQFLIYAVTCWCGLLPQNLNWNTNAFSFLFVRLENKNHDTI